MKLRDIELTERNHFVAMEYYFLIMNRTFLIIKTQDYLIGIQGNGLVSTEGGEDPLTLSITSSMAIRGDLSNPYTYLKNKYLTKIEDLDLEDGSIVRANKTNFIIKLKDIKSATYNHNKKFGMGPYLHDGRVIIDTHEHKKREFIIMGNQSGKYIANFITTS